ncbi:hypothetical protein F2Q70_00033902 [Brassica cretica]|uniref:SEC7 domain-containing protein n=1 Tax=Brassica cretica TaxID=69181 RepID=A0A8S9JZK3_BRACR|nr:hypothetical protein F2Q70_00033902 [Brassica cretica]
MSTSQTLGGATRCGRVIGPSLDKIIKNAAWRKHTYLVSSCKSVLDKLESLPDDFHDPSSAVAGLSSPDADAVLQPFLFSLDTAYSKVVEPALDCAFKLFSLSVIRGEIQSSKQDSVLFKLVNAVSKVGAMAEEPIQLAVLRVLLAAVRSPCVLIRGDCLLHVVKTCYNIYLGGLSGTTQICAKSVLAQMMLVIFTRSEEDSLADVAVKTVYVNELLAFTDKSVNEGSSVYFCQGFVNEVMAAGQGSPLPPPDVIQILLQNPETETVMTPDSPSFRGYEKNGEADSLTGDMSKMRQDAFLLFKNLCKLSMRFSSQEKNDDQIMVRGKTLSLELLKVIIDNGGPVWRSAYHSVTDVSILRFILEVSWGPMLAAFSVTLDQSDDRLATSLCLQGFRYAVHVTAVMGMQTQRDAFVTSMAKFTNLHCAADMKQKNVDAVKAIITIAIEDGNHLQGSWEHILTCLSRIEHLQLLGEGSSHADTRYIPTTKAEVDEKKALGFPHLKKRGALQNPSVMAVVRGGSYDSTSLVKTVPKLVTPEQIKNFIANLNLLDQIGNFELNHVYANSQRLNSEAIVAFVKALCKVSMSELQSPADPRVFSLTKLVETAHYNMNRIRLVWSRIWNVLSDFFVSVGLSENLSVAIFVMDSLRQLSMKFLEREELANYHFQHEFLRPFVVVMQNSSSAEIRELIVRCVSQMVLSRVSNVQSGWKSVFTVFTTAAIDERKNIVLLAFETIEKIVRDHFHCITETEISVYADCIRCLITFTNSKFEGDIGFNSIEFLRFCAVKLAEGGLFLNEKLKNDNISALKEDSSDGQSVTDLDEQVSYWVPLLSAIRKRSIEVLFNILMDHGHLFTRPFWAAIFSSIILPVFNNMRSKTDMLFEESSSGYSPSSASLDTEETTWDAETSTLALQLLVDLLANFFSSVRSQLSSVVSIILGFIKSPVQGSTGSGISVLLRLADGLARSASEDEWTEVFLALKEAASLTFAGFMKVLRTMDDIEDVETSSGQSVDKDDLDDDNLHIMSYVVSRTKKHIDVLSQIVEVVSELYRRNQYSLPASHVDILADIFSCIASHAQQLNTDTVLRRKFKRACSVQNLTQPQLLNFENEANKSYMTFLQDMVTCNPDVSKELELESRLVTECSKVVKIYLNCTGQHQQQTKPIHWILPMEFDRTEEAKARTSLLVSSLEALCSLEAESLKRHVSSVFPLLVDLVKTEHCSPQVPYALSNVLKSCIRPILG